jgi:alkylation response protein AidB-like acyl-CoA dehydrogenase
MADPGLARDVEDLDAFRHRLRDWLKENMPPADPRLVSNGNSSDEEELAEIARNRKLQRLLFDGGFAGIIFPKEYGGAGLTPAHQEVLNTEIVGYQYPSRIQVPTFSPCAAVINDFGTEEQKRRKSGPPAPGGRTGGCAWPGRTGTCPSTAACPCSCSGSTSRASR